MPRPPTEQQAKWLAHLRTHGAARVTAEEKANVAAAPLRTAMKAAAGAGCRDNTIAQAVNGAVSRQAVQQYLARQSAEVLKTAWQDAGSPLPEAALAAVAELAGPLRTCRTELDHAKRMVVTAMRVVLDQGIGTSDIASASGYSEHTAYKYVTCARHLNTINKLLQSADLDRRIHLTHEGARIWVSVSAEGSEDGVKQGRAYGNQAKRLLADAGYTVTGDLWDNRALVRHD